MAEILAFSYPARTYQAFYRTARRIVGDPSNPYAATLELEAWFRSGAFQYDETPPQSSTLPPLVAFVTQSIRDLCRDARNLALYLAKDLLPEVRMKDKPQPQLASLTQTRDTLVKLRTALKNKVNNILSARGPNLAKEALSSEKKLAEVLELPFDEIVRIELRVIVEQIRSLNRSIAELEKTIGEEGSKLEGHKGLSSIKGIGKITGAILLSVIGDVNDFPDEGRLASYFGIVPRVSNSNVELPSSLNCQARAHERRRWQQTLSRTAACTASINASSSSRQRSGRAFGGEFQQVPRFSPRIRTSSPIARQRPVWPLRTATVDTFCGTCAEWSSARG